MNRSIYDIKADIEAIFDEIYANNGEITEEQLEELSIKQDELRDKLDSYRHVLSRYNRDVEYCKAEETRIAVIRKRNQKIVDRLKGVMLDAVLRYGNENKNGNKYVEFPDGKIATKATKVIEVNDMIAYHFKTIVIDRLKELYDNGMLDAADAGIGIELQSLDLESFIATVNANYVAEYPEEFEQVEGGFTVDDLFNYGIKIEFELSLADLCKVENYDITNATFNHDVKVIDDINKTSIKRELDNGAKINIAKQCINQTLSVK